MERPTVLRILVLDVLVAVSPILVGLGAYVLVRLFA
jgi:hypothetical protein